MEGDLGTFTRNCGDTCGILALDKLDSRKRENEYGYCCCCDSVGLHTAL